jgi:CDP-4-dehydro-6-deoxyglucose reductase, E3
MSEAFQVTVQPSGRQFMVNPGEAILAAGIRQGVGMPYGCKDGVCGSCKCKLVSGQVTIGAHQQKALSDAEQAAGFVLTCQGFAYSDIVLESRQVSAAGAHAVRKMPARVMHLEKKSHDVMLLRLQLPANDAFTYFPGQYMEFILKDNARRNYSMATAPGVLTKDDGNGNQVPANMIELHIRHLPGGLFTDQVFATMKEKDILRIEGPYGSFYLREDSDKPIILLASGTGFAPIKALIEHMHIKGISRPATLYWGGRRPGDLYLDAWVKQKLAELPNLRYVPVISDALPEDAWDGRTGFVHAAVLQDHPDLSGHQVYACGAPIVVDSARAAYTNQGKLDPDEFYADSFITEADRAKTQ